MVKIDGVKHSPGASGASLKHLYFATKQSNVRLTSHGWSGNTAYHGYIMRSQVEGNSRDLAQLKLFYFKLL